MKVFSNERLSKKLCKLSLFPMKRRSDAPLSTVDQCTNMEVLHVRSVRASTAEGRSDRVHLQAQGTAVERRRGKQSLRLHISLLLSNEYWRRTATSTMPQNAHTAQPILQRPISARIPLLGKPEERTDRNQ